MEFFEGFDDGANEAVAVDSVLQQQLRTALQDDQLGVALALLRRLGAPCEAVLRRLGLTADGHPVAPVSQEHAALINCPTPKRADCEQVVSQGRLPALVAACATLEVAGEFVAALLAALCDMERLEPAAVEALSQPLRDELAPLPARAVALVLHHCTQLHRCHNGALMAVCIGRGRSEAERTMICEAVMAPGDMAADDSGDTEHADGDDEVCGVLLVDERSAAAAPCNTGASDQQCCVCRLFRAPRCFSRHQRMTRLRGQRKCLACTSQLAPATLAVCSNCRRTMARANFSNTQWKRRAHARLCITCASNNPYCAAYLSRQGCSDPSCKLVHSLQPEQPSQGSGGVFCEQDGFG